MNLSSSMSNLDWFSTKRVFVLSDWIWSSVGPRRLTML
jgi:hypothetical protein